MFWLKDFPARTLDRKKKLNSSNIWRAGWGIWVVTCRAVVKLVWTQRRWRMRVKIFLNESSLWGPSMGRRHKEDPKRTKLQPREWVRWSVHSMRSTIHGLDYSLWKLCSSASGPHVRFQELYQGWGKWHRSSLSGWSFWRSLTCQPAEVTVRACHWCWRVCGDADGAFNPELRWTADLACRKRIKPPAAWWALLTVLNISQKKQKNIIFYVNFTSAEVREALHRSVFGCLFDFCLKYRVGLWIAEKEECAAALSLLLWRRTTALCTFILKDYGALRTLL